MKNKEKKATFKITKGGSLGLLAYGDIGLREWRKVRNELLKNEESEKE